jgi:hypothetical protein
MGKAKKITIDPGATGSGWAVWDAKWMLLGNGIVIPPSAFAWETKAYWVVTRLEEVAEKWGCTEGYIEYPAFFQVHGAGVATSGALVKLAWFVGLVCGSLPFPPELVTVNEWKGQLPKEVVIKRIKKILPAVNAKSHDWDAIGMGLYLKGDMK